MSSSAPACRLRRMLPEDVPAGLRLSTIAGWNQSRGDWERFLAASPEGCFVAESGAGVVGTSATIIYGGAVGWIGMVLVDPAERGMGIGTALLERAVRHLDERGIPSVKLDATPQGRPLYERIGFEAEYDIERWLLVREAEGAGEAVGQTEGMANGQGVGEAQERAQGEVEEQGQGVAEVQAEVQAAGRDADASVRRSSAAALAPDLLALDREVFGADRSALLRSVAREAPELVQRIDRGPSLAGYALGRRGRIADHLGPWVARDERAAARLLDGFLTRSRRARIFVDRVLPCPWSGALLESRGFRFARPLTRMFRGGNAYAGHPVLQGGILGPEFG